MPRFLFHRGSLSSSLKNACSQRREEEETNLTFTAGFVLSHSAATFGLQGYELAWLLLLVDVCGSASTAVCCTAAFCDSDETQSFTQENRATKKSLLPPPPPLKYSLSLPLCAAYICTTIVPTFFFFLSNDFVVHSLTLALPCCNHVTANRLCPLFPLSLPPPPPPPPLRLTLPPSLPLSGTNQTSQWPSVPRRPASSESTVPVMVLPSVRW